MNAIAKPALLALLPALLVAGCGGMNRGSNWPSLATRPGEMAPMVPRAAAGTCPGCGQDVSIGTTAATPPPPPAAPADIATRLAAVEASIARVEKQVPAQRRQAGAALAAGDRSDTAEAEVQRSRYEAVFQPLAAAQSQLDAIEDDLAGTAAPEAMLANTAALRARLQRLTELRAALP